jgi:hypothetical protein
MVGADAGCPQDCDHPTHNGRVPYLLGHRRPVGAAILRWGFLQFGFAPSIAAAIDDETVGTPLLLMRRPVTMPVTAEARAAIASQRPPTVGSLIGHT